MKKKSSERKRTSLPSRGKELDMSEEEAVYQMDEESESESVYEIEQIIDKKKFGNEWKYSLKWVGYPKPTWEPKENINKKMLSEFESDLNKENNKSNLN